MTLSTLDQKFFDWLNGDDDAFIRAGNPFGLLARELRMGTRFQEVFDLVASDGDGADAIPFDDSTTPYWATDTVGAIIREIEALVGGTNSTARNYTKNQVLTDNEALVTSLDKLDTEFWKLAQVTTGNGASKIGIEDSGTFYPGATVEAALGNLASALGGTNTATRNWTKDHVLADNDSFFTALDKLDTKFWDLAQVTTGAGAALVGVEDAGTWYAGATVEAALGNLATALGGTNNATRNWTKDHVLADNDSFFTALDKLDTKFWDLAQVTTGAGAALVGVEDAGTWYAGATVEACLSNLAGAIGGTNNATRTFTKSRVAVNNEALFTTLDKLDTEFWNLAQVTTGQGASKIGIEDAGSLITATTVEGALAEFGTKFRDGQVLKSQMFQLEYTALTANAQSQEVQFPANMLNNTMVMGVYHNLMQEFNAPGGGGNPTQATLDCGINGGDTDCFTTALNVWTGAGTGEKTSNAGVAFTGTPSARRYGGQRPSLTVTVGGGETVGTGVATKFGAGRVQANILFLQVA